MASTAGPSSIGGFTIFPLKYSASATHNLYVRAHTGTRPAGLPQGRTLFAVNTPPDATERELSALFGTHGTIERVVFGFSDPEAGNIEDASDEDEPIAEEPQPADSSSSEDEHPRKKRKVAKSGKGKTKVLPTKPPKVVPLVTVTSRILRPAGGSAHVVFLDASSMDRFLASLPSSKPTLWPPAKLVDPEPSGLAYFAARYRAARPAHDQILAHAESAILAFDYQLEKEKRQQKSQYRKGEEIVDEDGFTLVVRGGAYGQSVGGGVGVASKRFELNAAAGKDLDAGSAKRKKKKEKKEKEGFYAFQIREKNLKGASTCGQISLVEC